MEIEVLLKSDYLLEQEFVNITHEETKPPPSPPKYAGYRCIVGDDERQEMIVKSTKRLRELFESVRMPKMIMPIDGEIFTVLFCRSHFLLTLVGIFMIVMLAKEIFNIPI